MRKRSTGLASTLVIFTAALVVATVSAVTVWQASAPVVHLLVALLVE